MSARVLACFVACLGCGRIGFDGGAAGTSDGPGGDSGAHDGNDGDATGAQPMMVTGGTFYRTHDVGSDGAYPTTAYLATIRDFQLDRYPVTVGRFRAFVDAGFGTRAAPPASGAGAHGWITGSGWDPAWNASLAADSGALRTALQCDATYETWTSTAGGNEDKPINCVTWFEAMAFCAWEGGFLPTMTELNYAAVGGSEHRAFPWSSPATDTFIDCAHANYKPGDVFCENPPTGGLRPVGTSSPQGDGRFGHADLVGNLYAWTLDWYQSPLASPCDDCAALTVTSFSTRVLRGGSFITADPQYVRGASWSSDVPDHRSATSGLRCGRAP